MTYTATQSNLLSVNFDSSNSATAATQIQDWLNGFAPVMDVSDATHAVVNAIDPNDFVIDFGAATQGLDQSALLQYLSAEALPSTTPQNLTFTSTAGYTYTPGNPLANPEPTPAYYTFNPISGSIELQVGTVTTAPIDFDIIPNNPIPITSTTEAGNIVTIMTGPGGAFAVGDTVVITAAGIGYDGTYTIASATGNMFTYNSATMGLNPSTGGLATDTSNLPNSTDATAGAMQTALNNALASSGVTAIVSGTSVQTNLPTAAAVPGVSATFTVTFTSAEPPVQFINAGAATVRNPFGTFPANFSNSADTTTLSSSTTSGAGVSTFTTSQGFLPAVQLTVLDKPFTVNNIPVSTSNATLTAEAISNYFTPAPITGTQAVAPFDFPPPEIAASINSPYPYYEPVAINPLINTAPAPATFFVTVAPVINADGSASTTQFDVTFGGISGTLVDAPMVITNAVNVYGNALGSTIVSGEGVPTGSTAASVTVIKESGNEFQVNPPEAVNIFNSGTALNSDQPAVAMDGSGNFMIASARGSPAAIGAEGHYRHLLPPLRADGHHDRQRARRAIQRRRGQPDQRALLHRGAGLGRSHAAVDAGVQPDHRRPLHGHFRAPGGIGRDGADFLLQRGSAHQRGQHRVRPGESRLCGHPGYGGW